MVFELFFKIRDGATQEYITPDLINPKKVYK